MPPWRSLGASWAPSGPQVATKAALRPPLGGSWDALGCSWGPVLGRSWRLLGPSWACRGAPGNHFGPLGSFLAPCFELPWKIAQNLEKHCFFCLSIFVFKVCSPPGVQHPPRIAPKSFPEASRGPLAPQEAPKNRNTRPKKGQERPKSAPRAPKSAARAPKSVPRAAQERPETPQRALGAPL